MERYSKPDPLQIISELITQQLQDNTNKTTQKRIVEVKHYIDNNHQNLLTSMRSNLNQNQLLDNLLEIYKFIFINAISENTEYEFFINVLLGVLRKHPKICKEAISEILKHAKNKNFSSKLITECIQISQKHESTQYGTSLSMKVIESPSGIERNKSIKLLSDADEEKVLNHIESLRYNGAKITFSCENKNYYVTQEIVDIMDSSAMIQCENYKLKEGDYFRYLKTDIYVKHVGERLILNIKKENNEVEELLFSNTGFIGSDLSANYKDSDLKKAHFDLIKIDMDWFIKNNYVEIILYKYLHNTSNLICTPEKIKIDAPQRHFKVELYEFVLLQENDTK